MDQTLKDKLATIRLLALDFDGVLTDGHVYVDQDGRESVKCSRRDGLGLGLLQKAGIEVMVVSKETNRVVAARCEKLKIPYVQGIESGEGKREVLERAVRERGLSHSQVAFMGDDVNDIEALHYAGVSLTVADAHSSLLGIVDYVTERKSGEHAVREVCDLILTSRGMDRA